MTPAIKVTANTSGALLWGITSGSALKSILQGLKIDNKSPNDLTVDLLDCFTTDSSKTNAAGAAQGAEDFATIVASGKVRFQATIPPGEFQSFGKEDLVEVTFLGKAYARTNSTTSDAVIVASYKLC